VSFSIRGAGCCSFYGQHDHYDGKCDEVVKDAAALNKDVILGEGNKLVKKTMTKKNKKN
jgi:hypothetical protein